MTCPVWVSSHTIPLADYIYIKIASYPLLRWCNHKQMVLNHNDLFNKQTNCPHSFLILFENGGKPHKGQFSWLSNICKKKKTLKWSLIVFWSTTSIYTVDMSIMEQHCTCSLRICPLMMSLWHRWFALGINLFSPISVHTHCHFGEIPSVHFLSKSFSASTNVHTRLQSVTQTTKSLYIQYICSFT